MKSILSEIVSKYSRQTENICSESFALIINNSEGMQRAFNQLVLSKSNLKIDLGFPFKILTQVTSKKDSSIPDLEIQTSGNQKHLVETKFWAGLTEHQPNSYLKRILETNDSGSLLFIVPERRITALVNETSRIAKAEFQIEDGNFGYLVNGKVNVLFFSWFEILDALWSTANNSNDNESIYNLYQLRMLVNHLDSQGFIPFDSNIFTPAAAKQRDQLVDLIDDLVRNTSSLVKRNLSYGGGKYSVQNYVKLNDKLCSFLMYSSELWMKYQDTPLYFCVALKDWDTKEPINNVREIQQSFLTSKMETRLEDGLSLSYQCILIPMFTPLGLDKENTYINLKQQLDVIIEKLMPFAE